jgi:hypothetical protein
MMTLGEEWLEMNELKWLVADIQSAIWLERMGWKDELVLSWIVLDELG